MEASDNISQFELLYQISTAFKTHSYIKENFPDGFIDGWRLLARINSKKGQHGKLILFDTDGDIMLRPLDQEVQKHGLHYPTQLALTPMISETTKMRINLVSQKWFVLSLP